MDKLYKNLAYRKDFQVRNIGERQKKIVRNSVREVDQHEYQSIDDQLGEYH